MSELCLNSHSAVKSTLKMIDNFSDILNISIIDQTSINTTQSINYSKVWAHRENYYYANAPHLLQPSERELESKLDHRGIIFMVSNLSSTLASLRLIQRPFEIEDYEFNSIDFNSYSNYWEIGRLVTSPELDHIALALIVQYLLCFAGLELFSSKGCKGLIGICKPINTRFFSKFGMASSQDIYCKNRNLNYKMLHGDINDILNSTSKIIKHESRIRSRLTFLTV